MSGETLQEKMERVRREQAELDAHNTQTNAAPGAAGNASGAAPVINASANTYDPDNPTKDGQINRPAGVVDPKLPSTFDSPGAMPARSLDPHTVQVTDGIRGNNETLPYQQRNLAAAAGQSGKLVSDGSNVYEENEYVEELQKMHDEIEELTKKYTAGGLQVSDFPSTYHQLTNRYRIRAAQLNSAVGRMGPEEAKAQAEVNEMKIKLEQRLTEARLKDARAAEDRRKEHSEEKQRERDADRDRQNQEQKNRDSTKGQVIA